MPTVPGQRDNVVDMIHPAFRPTQADFLQAAAITHGMGRLAMDITGMHPSTNIEDVRGKSEEQKMIEENESRPEIQEDNRRIEQEQEMEQEHRRMRRYRPEIG